MLAKVLGTAVVGRLFVLLERQLMQFAWFARVHAWWTETKQTVTAALRRSAAWRAAQSVRRASQRWWQRRFG